MAYVQDDTREDEIRQLAGLQKKGGRSDPDAHLVGIADHEDIPFELKSSTGNSVSTGRDVGHDHLNKWNNIDWLVGFYTDRGGELILDELYHFGPGDLDWFEEKMEYIQPDYDLLELLSKSIDDRYVTEVFGPESEFDIEVVKKFLKRQKMYPSGEKLTVSMIGEMADLPSGKFSRMAMTKVVKERAKYLIHRGGTLNNPHIPKSEIISKGTKIDISDEEFVKSKIRGLVLSRINKTDQ